MQWFRNCVEAAIVIEQWRRHYNQVRPYSSLGYLSPSEFKITKHRPHPQPERQFSRNSWSSECQQVICTAGGRHHETLSRRMPEHRELWPVG